MSSINGKLRSIVLEYESMGCEEKRLGICDMPKGYALMLNEDESHYFWLCYDGRKSVIFWDKWRVYRAAKADKAERDRFDNLKEIAAALEADKELDSFRKSIISADGVTK